MKYFFLTECERLQQAERPPSFYHNRFLMERPQKKIFGLTFSDPSPFQDDHKSWTNWFPFDDCRHLNRCLNTTLVTIGFYREKKPSTQRDSNPTPLCSESCSLPLRYNCCPARIKLGSSCKATRRTVLHTKADQAR